MLFFPTIQDAEKQHQDEIDASDRQITDLETAVKDLQKAKISGEREHDLHVQDLKLSVEELQRFKQSSGNESMRKETEIAKLQSEVGGTTTVRLSYVIAMYLPYNLRARLGHAARSRIEEYEWHSHVSVGVEDTGLD